MSEGMNGNIMSEGMNGDTTTEGIKNDKITEGIKNDTTIEGIKNDKITENKTKRTATLSDYLEVIFLVIAIILLIVGIFYMLFTISGIGYLTYKYKGFWVLVDFLIAAVTITIGAIAMVVAEEYRKKNLDRDYAAHK